jgi:hypothetical protein
MKAEIEFVRHSPVCEKVEDTGPNRMTPEWKPVEAATFSVWPQFPGEPTHCLNRWFSVAGSLVPRGGQSLELPVYPKEITS